MVAIGGPPKKEHWFKQKWAVYSISWHFATTSGPRVNQQFSHDFGFSSLVFKAAIPND